VDLDVFGPHNLDRFDERDRELVVGWAGNSEWNARSGQDPKGFHTIVKPALEMLNRQGYRMRGHFADRSIEWRPHSKMADYYAEIDVLICASEVEGTPNPVLEAAACGVPVVTTDVGIVDELLGPEQKKFILLGRSVEALMSSLKILHDDRSLLRQLSDENIRQVQGWTWQSRMPAWLAFFKQAEAAREERARFTEAYLSMMMQMRHRIDFLEAKVKASGAQQGALGRSVNKTGIEAK
jgi:glycosyltransferase involved in cell wall biosynthesis